MKTLSRFSVSAALSAAVFAFCLIVPVSAATAVNLGTASTFSVLGGSAIDNTGSTVIGGDIGSFPTATITGFLPGVVNGTNHGGDAVTQSAKTDLTTAYGNAAGQSVTSTVPTELGGTTKTPGVYNSADGTFQITGTLTLDAQGDSHAVFIFKTASTLVTAGSSVINLVGGAQPCNIFWQVGSSATLGTNSTFKGNILALTSITLTTGANVEGSTLARNGAVTLDTNIINSPVCVIPPQGSSPSLATVTVPPLISVKKIPTPLALPSGPGSVTYDYTVLNVGTVAMSNITIADNKCSGITSVSGDVNGNSQLDVTETWMYRCTTNISTTTTNTVTVTGQANGHIATDTANATVVVGLPVVPPLIHLVKKPDAFVLSSPGRVTYTYTMTNPGTVALNNVSLVDNKCGYISAPSGDVNNNGMLDVSEVWTYTCWTNLATNTVNIATAEGSANGLTAIDYATATVVVSSPKLPDTGIDPSQKALLNVVIPVGLLVLVSGLLVVSLKKRAA